jgi:hypothetical protein
MVRRWREARAPALLLASLRSEGLRAFGEPGSGGLAQWLTRLEREAEPISLKLVPLSEQDTVELVLGCLAPPAPDFAQWLFDETHGHPFYLMETLKDLLERSALHPKRRADGRWGFEVDADHELGRPCASRRPLARWCARASTGSARRPSPCWRPRPPWSTG